MGRKICIIGIVFIGGCTLGPRYELPETPVPAEWKSTPTDGEEISEFEYWWEVFEDETLSELEKMVIDHNPDLYVALERVVEARAVAGVSKADLYPELSLSPSYDNIGELIELFGLPTGIIPGLKPIVRVHETYYELPLTMNYEIDLWGKFRGQYKSASFEADSLAEAFRGTLLTLTSDLASNYFNMRIIDTQTELMEEILELRGEALELSRARFEAGLVDYTEVMDAEQNLADNEAEMEDLKRQRTLFENAIAVLIGLPASNFCSQANPLQQDPPQIPAGVPASILIQRPDIAQAERKMASLHAMIGVAYSSFFPALKLTGAIGSLSTELSDFLTWKSRLWRMGVDIVQTIFDGWKRRSHLDAAWARFRETQGNYLKTVLAAFQETEDALNNIDQQKREWQKLDKAYEAAEIRASLSEKRYEKGIANLLEVIENRRVEIEALRKQMNILGLQYQSTVQLIKALGGDWQIHEELLEPSSEEKPCSR